MIYVQHHFGVMCNKACSVLLAHDCIRRAQMSYTPLDTLKWAMKEMEMHSAKIMKIVEKATNSRVSANEVL
jgi:hypothetical protein